MKRDLRVRRSSKSNRHYNFAAAIIAGGAIAFVYYSFDPVIAGDDLTESTLRISRLEQQAITAAPTVSEQVPDPQEIGDEAEPKVLTAQERQDLVSEQALKNAIAHLSEGVKQFSQQPHYSATLSRQERIDGELKDEQEMQMKVRHAPFSVYMKWNNYDRGRQVLYTEGENEGRMLVKLGGFKGRLLPTIKLDPEGDRAKAESRHPITQAGLINMAQEIIKNREYDLSRGQLPMCVLEEGHQFNDRPCYRLYIEYPDAEASPMYRKTITMIDAQMLLPVYVRNYTWPNENTVDVEQETLIECYSYRDIQFTEQLAEADWAEDNPSYRFVR